MINISSIVQQTLSEDAFAREAMERGLLNTSAYAKEIHKKVEQKAMKQVKQGSIVVALTRIAKKIKKTNEFLPQVKIDSYSITSGLCEVTYERTAKSTQKITQLNNSIINSGDFFTVTEGLHEITIVCTANVTDKIISHFNSEPKVILKDLVSISVRFSADYVDVPNTIYSLVGSLAVRQINVMEIVSTYTELTFVVFQNEMTDAVQALNAYSCAER